ncbi:MAG: Gfo/Idh/MocA family oxidoreductase [Planctomycetes bacterium]|nr:Gfo/Idh/MocA family oxidoreductase [Planctomycetota bacterium]
MSKQTLRALVLGAGYAGQGHALALRSAGVEVVGMSSRTADVGAKIAASLNIPRFSASWPDLLADLQPEIVAVGTPGGTHLEMITAAIEAGCHVLADKPLATTAADARQLFELAQQRGVKTAYAASYWYQPQALFARQLIAAGVLGKVVEMEGISHFNWPPLMPFGWPHRLEMGGGRLNNNFPHKLAIAQNVLQGEVLAVMGESRRDLERVPVAGQIHDFREFSRQAMSPEQAARLQWAPVNSDWAYTALLRIGRPEQGLDDAVSVTFRHSALRQGRHGDYMAIYGEKGTIHVEGTYMQGPVYLKTDGPTWEELPIPLAIRDALPAEPDNTQRNWNQLAREFVADIQGLTHPRYLTFRDGWIYQEVIDTIRSNRCWTMTPG